MAPAIGDTVVYQLSLDDARRVSAQRGTSATSARGNRHRVGDRLPLVVTAVAVVDGVPRVNGQVLLDGADQLWVTSAKDGDGLGQWRPARKATDGHDGRRPKSFPPRAPDPEQA